jgi:CO/xanthine dehydrogenase FAD-binding subunit
VATRVPASYLRPASLPEALDALADAPRLVLAGGTDVYPAHTTRPVERPVLDISRVEGLRGIRREDDASWRIGATTTWTDIAESRLLPPAFDGLRQAARQVGGRQIQNAGTIAGNIVNGSPAADGTPNLLALDAVVECASAARGVRRLPLVAFATGYRSTALLPDELVTAVIVGSAPDTARSTFHKLGSRAYLVISIVAVAVVLEVRDGRVAAARVAVGACSPVPVRLVDLERDLVGAPADGADRDSGGRSLSRLVEPRHLEALSPIDDVRAPAGYRFEAALTLVRRALAEVGA